VSFRRLKPAGTRDLSARNLLRNLLALASLAASESRRAEKCVSAPDLVLRNVWVPADFSLLNDRRRSRRL